MTSKLQQAQQLYDDYVHACEAIGMYPVPAGDNHTALVARIEELQEDIRNLEEIKDEMEREIIDLEDNKEELQDKPDIICLDEGQMDAMVADARDIISWRAKEYQSDEERLDAMTAILVRLIEAVDGEEGSI